MVLVDTSVWVDFLGKGHAVLQQLLEDGEVFVHPFVVGELALGRRSRRSDLISRLNRLPQARVATHQEILVFIDHHGLAGSGLGYVDAHLLASTLLTAPVRLLTRDRKLVAEARRLAVAY